MASCYPTAMAAASIRPPQVPSPPAPGVSRWTAPRWVQSFYSRFPLVTLEQEDTPEWTKERRLNPEAECSLWVRLTPLNDSLMFQVEPPREATHQYHRTWASPHPPCLRTQLLFLLRDPPLRVQFRPWSNPSSAPGGTLPALHLSLENRLVSSDEIRPWLDSTHPIKGKGKE
jgi:metaxin